MPDRASTTDRRASLPAPRAAGSDQARLGQLAAAGLARTSQRNEQALPPGCAAAIASEVAGLPVRRHRWVFRGTPNEISEARRRLAGILADCPMADDAVLCLSEMATNSVLHSASGRPGGTFTVRAEVRDGHSVRLEVQDNGGHWQPSGENGERLHGLGIVRALATHVSTHGDAATGWVISALFDWPATRFPARAGCR